MEILLFIVAIGCLLGGLAGAILPLPGPSLSFAGILLLHFSKFAEFNNTLLYSLGFATLVITLLDYYIPIWGTKKFGGTRYGTIGAVLGLLVGFFLIPGIGIFIGTFLGALFGELIGGSKIKSALTAAIGSFVGFVTGIIMQVIICLVMIGYAIAGILK